MARSTFGRIDKLPSGKYRARYTRHGIKNAETFPTEAEAQAWLDEEERRSASRPVSGAQLAEVTFKDLAERWRKLPKRNGKPKSTKTAVDYELTLRLHVYPFLGDFKIKKFDGNIGLISAFQDYLEDHLEDQWRTNQKAQNYTRWVLRFAQRKGAIQFNPYDDEEICMPDVPKRRDPIELDEADIDSLEAKMPEHYAVVIPFTAYSGLRAGELWALRRKSYNPLRREVSVTHSIGHVTGKGLVEGPTKNRQTRKVVLPEVIADQLDAWMKEHPGAPDAPLFPTPKGTPVHHSNFWEDVFRPAVVAAKLPDKTRFHDLRHFCAHFHISEGMEPFDIMTLMGHSSINVTMDIYGGMFARRREEMARKADAAIRKQRNKRKSA